jgi:NAD(P)-dependent dehydrogenase (short-subunit alcohol dehydrogenase family)
MSLLRDRVVLISGGTQELGAGTAWAAANEGALVAVIGQRRELGAALVAELARSGPRRCSCRPTWPPSRGFRSLTGSRTRFS